MSDASVATPLPYSYRQTMANHVAQLGNAIVAQAFAWFQGQTDDGTFEIVLLNSQIEFTRLLHLVHNERVINSMEQDVVSGATQIIEDSNNRPNLPTLPAALTPPVVPEPPITHEPHIAPVTSAEPAIPEPAAPPTREEERREENGPTAPDPD